MKILFRKKDRKRILKRKGKRKSKVRQVEEEAKGKKKD